MSSIQWWATAVSLFSLLLTTVPVGSFYSPCVMAWKMKAARMRVAHTDGIVSGYAHCKRSFRFKPYFVANCMAGDLDLHHEDIDYGESDAWVEPPRVHAGRKTIGVDYGLRRTGICVSVGFAPRPLPLIEHKNEPLKVAEAIAYHAKRELAEQVVVGLPLNSRGEEGEQANSTRVMVGALANALPECGIYFWDERFSTSIAKEKLREAGYGSREMKGVVDVMASIGILQDFFEHDGEGAEVAHVAVAKPAAVVTVETSLPQQSYKEWMEEARRQTLADAGEVRKGKGKKKR